MLKIARMRGFNNCIFYLLLLISRPALSENDHRLTFEYLAPQFVATSGVNDPAYDTVVSKISPARAEPGDFVEEFYAPSDGARIVVVVKSPVTKKTLHAGPMRSGEDATNYFTNAIQQAGANSVLIFPRNHYKFSIKSCNKTAGYVNFNVPPDIVIDGQGSTLDFSATCIGIGVNDAARFVLKNFVFEWPEAQFAEVGRITEVGGNSQIGYTYNLKVLDKYLTKSSAPIVAATAWDEARNYWSLENPAHDVSYLSTNPQPIINANGTATNVPSYSVQFTKGESVLIVNSRSGAAINGYGNDMTFENIDIKSGPGMGFLFGPGRGFRINKCTVERQDGKPISTTVDAVHMTSIGGDVVIENSIFSYQGDDGTNLNDYVSPISAVDTNQISLPNYANPRTNDIIGLFSGSYAFQGTNKIVAVTPNYDTLNTAVTLEQEIPSDFTGGFMADLTTSAARYIIRNNKYLHNRARGILAQSPYGLISGNTLRGQTMQHILVGSSGFWGEGPGAQDLIISNNEFSLSGKNASLAAIVVAQADQTPNPIYMPNAAPSPSSALPAIQNIIFANNQFESEPRGAFFISSGNNIVLFDNKYKNLNLYDGPNYASTMPLVAPTDSVINVVDSSNVLVISPVGQHDRWYEYSIWIDPNSTTNINEQKR